MATKKSTSRVDLSRNRAVPRTGADQDTPAASALREEPDLIEAIEEERHRLMKAEAVLDCVLIAMNEVGSSVGEDGCTEEDGRIEDRRPHYPSVLGLARDLVSQTINQLDSVRIRPMIAQLVHRDDYAPGAEKLGLGRSGKDEVKEGGNVTYLFSRSAPPLPARVP